MKVFVGVQEIARSIRNPVLTIGNFDGVHRGHQALFHRVREWAEKLHGESVVMTFYPQPLKVLAPETGPPLITLHEKKLELIASCGIDVTIVIPFDREFSKISAPSFVKDILVGKIGVRALVVGYDYRFGHGRQGDIDFLRQMGDEHGFFVDIVSGIRVEETVVSSTLIRQLIKDGDLREACRLLGRPYEVSGTVVTGRGRGGRLLGFPTANVRLSGQACPRPGVYAVQAEVNGAIYGGAANLGYNPTFGDDELSLEVHIFDFDKDIYGKPISVRFIDRLRDEQRFSGMEELVEQIRKDVARAREVLSKEGSLSCRGILTEAEREFVGGACQARVG
ncbi:MAG: bifunctional riboflavin kinase/FAD synthetase [Deltaproteobacteria bacterium]|nr:bifunctional riboflavin kinase/FAD synthetase [Deltaproteobacteria bacterium]